MRENTNLGKILVKLRGTRSLRTVAELTGISHTYLSLLEKGYDPRNNKEIKPSIEILQLLSKTYNYPYEKLLETAGYLVDETIFKDLNDKEKELIIRFRKLSSTSQMTVLTVIENLEIIERENKEKALAEGDGD